MTQIDFRCLVCDTETMRVCATPDCGKSIHPTTNKSGLCGVCATAAWRKANPAKSKDSSNNWKAANPDARREYEKRPAVVDARREKDRRSRARDPDKHKAKVAKWAKKNPARRNHNEAKRRAARLGAEGAFTYLEWCSILDSFGHICPRCGASDVTLTADHIIPISWGGPNWAWNIQPLCAPCNSSKRATMIIAYQPYKKELRL